MIAAQEKIAAKYGVTPPRRPRGAEIFWLRVYVPAYRAVPWPVRSAIMHRLPGSHAYSQGKVAGTNAAGGQRRYQPVSVPWGMMAGDWMIGGE